jgi:hypothetical protein
MVAQVFPPPLILLITGIFYLWVYARRVTTVSRGVYFNEGTPEGAPGPWLLGTGEERVEVGTATVTAERGDNESPGLPVTDAFTVHEQQSYSRSAGRETFVYLPGPQKRGTGGTLIAVWKYPGDQGHPPT